MTLALAKRQADDLRTALLDNGVRKVSIELQQGVAGSGWAVSTFKRGLGHHIVSRPPGTPGLSLVKRGRTDLKGPLANGYGGFDLTARILTMGWANHPGLGGPWSAPGWGTIPRDNGRPYIFGWEFEGGLIPWTDEMHDFMARCGAGTLDWLGTLPGNPGPAPLTCWGEHSTWAPRRKIDRLGYTTQSGRDRIAAVRSSTTGGFLMALSDKEQDEVLARLRSIDSNTSWLDQPVVHDGTPAEAWRRTLVKLDDLAAGLAELRAPITSGVDRETQRPPSTFIRWIDTNAYIAARGIEGIVADLDALRAEVRTLAERLPVEE